MSDFLLGGGKRLNVKYIAKIIQLIIREEAYSHSGDSLFSSGKS